MASFGHFLGRKVTVQYRVGDTLLPASGTFAADSGRSIFLEHHLEQKGKRSYFRWEIPYQFIYRIEEAQKKEAEPADQATIQTTGAAPSENPQAGAAAAGSGLLPTTGVSLISMPQRPKTA
jgi:hypothetical protein